jgi:acyl transferase domain-containing protein
MHKLLQDLGVNANFLAGHSLGEIIALTAAGALSITDAISIMDKRSRSFTEMESRDFGRMIAVQADIQSVKKLISESGLDIYLANINSKEQIIVSGGTDSIGSFCKFIKGQNVQYVELKVSHAFHSPIVEDASVRFSKSLNDIHFNLPCKAVYSNEQCKVYPAHTGKIREILQNQIVAPVNFMGTIESLYEKGVRLFIEVGPGNVLSKLTQSILNGKEHSVVSTNTREGN